MKSHILLLTLLLSCISSYSQTFGPDIIAFRDTETSVSEIFLQEALNGYIYAGYNYYNYPDQGYSVRVSTDGGTSWSTLIDFSVPGASGWYPQIMSMHVAGTDTTNMKIFLALGGSGAGGPAGYYEVAYYNAMTGVSLGDFPLGDFTTWGANEIAFASDSRHPMSTSAPYSVMIAYSTFGTEDSLNILYSSDGGNTFSESNLFLDTVLFSQVDVAYGSYHASPVGRFSIVFQKDNNLYVTTSDVGSPSTFTGSQIIDSSFSYTNRKCSNPIICMQSAPYENSSTDYSTVILAERNDSTSHAFVAFWLMDTQNGGIFNYEVIDSTSDLLQTPSISFSEMDSSFKMTYYNATTNELPILSHSIDFPNSWTRFSQDYPDTLDFSTPYPIIAASDSLMCLWKQRSDSTSIGSVSESIKFDRLSLSTNVNALKVNSDVNVFPNPSDANRVCLSSTTDIRQIEITNEIGMRVFIDKNIHSTNEYYLPVLSKGVYLINIKTNSGDVVKKLIVTGD